MITFRTRRSGFVITTLVALWHPLSHDHELQGAFRRLAATSRDSTKLVISVMPRQDGKAPPR
jgi:hypothetical protein